VIGGSLRINLELVWFDTLRFWHWFESIRDIAYFCQAWFGKGGIVLIPSFPYSFFHSSNSSFKCSFNLANLFPKFLPHRQHFKSLSIYPSRLGCRMANKPVSQSSTMAIPPIDWLIRNSLADWLIRLISYWSATYKQVIFVCKYHVK